jgi:glyoxylase-like metal-dependent hydrolase (beta-lactamase superfamily II)
MQQIMYRLFIAGSSGVVERAEIEHEIADGDVLPFGGGLRAIAAPGHSAGHMAFMLERDGGLLFAADACSNMGGLSLSIVYDDHAQGRRSLAALAKLTFAAVCFGHGPTLSGATARKFNQKWEA